MASTPVTHPARQILEGIDAKIGDLDQDEAHTHDRIALRVWREVRKYLADQLSDVEVESVLRAMPGTTRDHAWFLLGSPDVMYDPCPRHPAADRFHDCPDDPTLPFAWPDDREPCTDQRCRLPVSHAGACDLNIIERQAVFA